MPNPGVFDKIGMLVRPGQGGDAAYRQYEYPVAPSTSILVGDIVSLNASGQVQQGIALPGSNNTGTASGGNLPVLGIAAAGFTADPAGNDTTGLLVRTVLPVIVFDDDVEFALRLWDAVLGNTTQSNVVVGQNYQFQRWRGASASIWWYSLIKTQANGELKVIERFPNPNQTAAGQASADNYGILWCKASLSATVRQLA